LGQILKYLELRPFGSVLPISSTFTCSLGS